MRVNYNGISERIDGREPVRYGRQSGGNIVAVWFHHGLRKYDEPAWAMQVDLEFKISVSVDTLLVEHDGSVYAIDRSEFSENTTVLDGEKQLLALASDDFVTELADDPSDVLGRGLYIDNADSKSGGHHKRNNRS